MKIITICDCKNELGEFEPDGGFDNSNLSYVCNKCGTKIYLEIRHTIIEKD